MIAFAAVLWTARAQPHTGVTEHIGAALQDLAGRTPSRRDFEGCTLWVASPGASRAWGFSTAGGITAIGNAVVEDAAALAARTGVRVTPDLSLVAAAMDRWGEQCGEQIGGEYAVAGFDCRNRCLLALRDGLGIRVLYTASGTDGLIVTNALAAACHQRLGASGFDDAAIAAFLAEGGWIDDRRTPWRGVHMVPPGHTLSATPSGTVRLRPHWHFPAPSRLRLNDLELREGYRDVLAAAVYDRTRDRRSAILLSGGLDSATIAAAARIRQVDLVAYTVGYDRLAPNDDVRVARETARYLELTIRQIAGDEHGALAGGVPPPIDLIDEPTLADWRAVLNSVASDAQVVLYGEDGDALFLPPGYRSLRRAMPAFELATRVAAFLARDRALPYLGFRLRERVGGRRTHTPHPAWLSRDARDLLATARTPPVVSPTRTGPNVPHPTRPEARARLATGISRHLATLIAPETTRTAVELRLPLLDSRVLRYVMATPPIPWCQRKRLPREAFRGYLPASVLSRPKEGAAAFYPALVEQWRSTARAPMLDAAIALPEWIDRGLLEQTLQRGDWTDVMAAWRVIQLDRWRRHVSRVSREAVRV